MFCINCFANDTRVANSRPHKKTPTIWRRRRCGKCLKIFTTYERPSLADNKPIHLQDGQTEEFNLGKLIVSIANSFPHNVRDAQYNALWLAQTVEDELSTQYENITPLEIAVCTHRAIKRYDELAGLQYAAKHELLASVRQKRGRKSIRENH